MLCPLPEFEDLTARSNLNFVDTGSTFTRNNSALSAVLREASERAMASSHRDLTGIYQNPTNQWDRDIKLMYGTFFHTTSRSIAARILGYFLMKLGQFSENIDVQI